MIIRVFRARVHEGKQEQFRKFFMDVAVPLLRTQEGMISVTVGTPMPSTPTEFLMITQWESVDALCRFAGDEWQAAVIHPDEAHLLKETVVHHYVAAEPAVSADPHEEIS